MTEIMDDLKERYEGGEKGALMYALYNCLSNGWEPPEWVRWGFIGAFDDVVMARVGSWDDVFGSPHRKGEHFELKRIRRQLAPKVYIRALELQIEEGHTVDEGLFERVAAELNTSAATARRLYYNTQKAMQRNFERR